MDRAGRAILFVGCCVLTNAFAIVPSGAEVDRGATVKAVEAVIASGRHQLELPTKKPNIPMSPPPVPSAFWNFLNVRFGEYADLVRIMFWIVLAAALIFLLTPIGRAVLAKLARRSMLSKPKGGATLGSADSLGLEIGGDPVERARTLAAEGRFAEAIHILVLAAVDILAETRPFGKRGAFTNRELLKTLNREPNLKEAFGGLVAGAERIRFAGRTSTSDDVENAVAHFAAFKAGAAPHG